MSGLSYYPDEVREMLSAQKAEIDRLFRDNERLRRELRFYAHGMISTGRRAIQALANEQEEK